MGRLTGAVSQRADSYQFFVDYWEEEPDIANNTRVVGATAYIYCSKHTAYASNQAQKLIIDGTEFTNSLYVDLSPGVTVALVSGSKTITHDDDGTKTINISAECNLPDGSGWRTCLGKLKSKCRTN